MDLNSKINADNDLLQISPLSKGYLKETGSWGLFLAILGFIFIGILVLAAFFVGTFMSAFDDGAGDMISSYELIIGSIYVLFGLIYFFPIYYLYKFSTIVKRAIENSDNDDLDIAFKNIKSHYKYVGILTIIILSMYIMAAIAMVTLGGML